MSTVFEGIIFMGCEHSDEVVSSFDDNQLECKNLGQVSVAFRTGPRGEALFSERMDLLAASLSVQCDRSSLLRIDTRTGYRMSQIYRQGELQSTIGIDDEIWVPLDDEGEPIPDGPKMRLDELEKGEEYDTLFDVVYLALEELSFGLGKRLREEFYRFMDSV